MSTVRFSVKISLLAGGAAILLLSSACDRSKPDVAAPRKAAYVHNVSGVRADYSGQEIPARMTHGSEVLIRFDARNAGTETWPAKGNLAVRFGYHWANPSRRGDWQSIVWDDGGRAFLTSDVPPGSKAAISLKVKAPAEPDRGYKLIVAPLLEGPGGGWATEGALVANVEVS